MAFDNQTRNRLQRMVTQCRQILAEEFTSQLQGTYGIQPDGTVTDLKDLTHLDDDQRVTAGLLRERIKHIETSLAASKNSMKQAVQRLVIEQSFTILNRFAAMRMAEERGIILESVANGMNSRGFKVYEQTSGRALGNTYERYRTFVYCLWDELSIDLGALFDRFSPYGLLFPREKSLEKLLGILNDREIASLWQEDETIGWIYQYFNSKEEREAMRRASQAPRNSRELAVRNQFFTPRYVVEFLTDNTLGRTWYEMTRGNTRLKDRCRYLVRRPNEIFLNKGEEPPQKQEQEQEQEKSQEELLREPVYIPYRPLKEPREILMLDPACGSMHFGLYAFDLYEMIYEEAWDNYPELLADLRQQVSGKEEFLRLVPVLIIGHNINGIDIDHRAVQIANLSLWLRAQKFWKKQELKSTQRPIITRSNVVCAEPMPGEKPFLEEFTPSLQPPLLGELVRLIWEKMQLAGEAGALLKIEEEISSAIEEARKEWKELKTDGAPRSLFKDFTLPQQKELNFPVFDVKEDFWQEAENRVFAALKEFSEKAVSGQSYQRRMFSEEAVRGFSFIDICRKKYDVVLMNPPFGKYPKISEKYFKIEYKYGWIDCLSAFILRAKSLLIETGMLGAITSRTFLHLSRLTNLRENILIKNLLPLILIDLGTNVLDKAAVETCATIFQNINWGKINSFYSMFIDAKEEELKQKLNTKGEWEELLSKSKKIFLNSFLLLPDSVFAYDIDEELLRIFKNSKKDFLSIAKAFPGMTTLDNERFLRLTWEIPFESNWQWKTFSKGGTGKAFYQEFSLNVKWIESGREVKAKAAEKGDSPSRFIASEENYFKPGLTYPRVGNNFSVRVLPHGCIFAEKGISIFLKEGQKDINLLLGLLMFLNTFIVQKIVGLTSPNRFWESGSINKIPIKNDEYLNILGEFGIRSYELVRAYFLNDELSRFFININCHDIKKSNLEELIIIAEKIVRKNYGIEEQFNYNSIKLMDDKYDLDKNISKSELISYGIGLIFGRWDIRIGMDSSLTPGLPGPFDPLPVCPPGMLVGTDGLPAKTGGIVSEEWLRARPNAITLPPDNSVNKPTITDDDYPLRISWDGILTEDFTTVSGQSHPEYIVHRVREVLNLLWKDKAFAIEQEICDLLKIKDLETYFQKPAEFFQDHLKRYSKSRRQAPIYWPLSTASGSYTLWIYYHRLNDQTLYKCVNDFIDPKIREVERMVDKKRVDMGETAGLLRKQELEADMNFLQELKDLKNEFIRIAELPYKPNLNDGVLITAAPLNNLFRLPKWKKDLEKCWQKLEKGEYDWAHLAYTIWPDRVKEKCKTDKSLAIAHDLETLYQDPELPKKKSNQQR